MNENIGYHTRSYEDGVILTSGCFGGRIDQETVERLMRKFEVTVRPSGTPVFVDAGGRYVRLYLTVNPAKTEKGKAALREWNRENEKRLAEEEAKQEEQNEHLAYLLGRLSYEEAVKRLL